MYEGVGEEGRRDGGRGVWKAFMGTWASQAGVVPGASPEIIAEWTVDALTLTDS